MPQLLPVAVPLRRPLRVAALSRPLLLASDLDGTLIPHPLPPAGSSAALLDSERFARTWRGWRKRKAESAGAREGGEPLLVISTGRTLDLWRDVFGRVGSLYVPTPDYLICGVGTAVYEPAAGSSDLSSPLTGDCEDGGGDLRSIVEWQEIHEYRDFIWRDWDAARIRDAVQRLIQRDREELAAAAARLSTPAFRSGSKALQELGKQERVPRFRVRLTPDPRENSDLKTTLQIREDLFASAAAFLHCELGGGCVGGPVHEPPGSSSPPDCLPSGAMPYHPGKHPPQVRFRMVTGPLDVDPEREEACAAASADNGPPPRWVYVDLLPLRAGKANALRWIRDRLGVRPEDTVCAGDGDNDVDALQSSLNAIVVGNAKGALRKWAEEFAAPSGTRASSPEGGGSRERKQLGEPKETAEFEDEEIRAGQLNNDAEPTTARQDSGGSNPSFGLVRRLPTLVPREEKRGSRAQEVDCASAHGLHDNLARCERRQRVYLARGSAAAGVLEGLVALGFAEEEAGQDPCSSC